MAEPGEEFRPFVGYAMLLGTVLYPLLGLIMFSVRHTHFPLRHSHRSFGMLCCFWVGSLALLIGPVRDIRGDGWDTHCDAWYYLPHFAATVMMTSLILSYLKYYVKVRRTQLINQLLPEGIVDGDAAVTVGNTNPMKTLAGQRANAAFPRPPSSAQKPRARRQSAIIFSPQAQASYEARGIPVSDIDAIKAKIYRLGWWTRHRNQYLLLFAVTGIVMLVSWLARDAFMNATGNDRGENNLCGNFAAPTETAVFGCALLVALVLGYQTSHLSGDVFGIRREYTWVAATCTPVAVACEILIYGYPDAFQDLEEQYVSGQVFLLAMSWITITFTVWVPVVHTFTFEYRQAKRDSDEAERSMEERARRRHAEAAGAGASPSALAWLARCCSRTPSDLRGRVQSDEVEITFDDMHDVQLTVHDALETTEAAKKIFIQHLSKEFSQENALFYMAVQEIKAQFPLDEREQSRGSRGSRMFGAGGGFLERLTESLHSDEGGKPPRPASWREHAQRSSSQRSAPGSSRGRQHRHYHSSAAATSSSAGVSGSDGAFTVSNSSFHSSAYTAQNRSADSFLPAERRTVASSPPDSSAFDSDALGSTPDSRLPSSASVSATVGTLTDVSLMSSASFSPSSLPRQSSVPSSVQRQSTIPSSGFSVSRQSTMKTLSRQSSSSGSRMSRAVSLQNSSVRAQGSDTVPSTVSITSEEPSSAPSENPRLQAAVEEGASVPVPATPPGGRRPHLARTASVRAFRKTAAKATGFRFFFGRRMAAQRPAAAARGKTLPFPEALEIYETFLMPDAPLQCNISYHCRKELEAVFAENGSESDRVGFAVFDRAFDEVLRILEMDSWPRFKRSRFWPHFVVAVRNGNQRV